MPVIRDWGTAIITALSNVLALLTFIPRLPGFLVILLVGWLIATLVSKALTLSTYYTTQGEKQLWLG